LPRSAWIRWKSSESSVRATPRSKIAFDALVGEGEAIYHTAGVLGKGERIWLLAKLPDYIRVNGNDIVEKYLLLTNAHDGTGSVRVKLTPIRVVCENTLTLALTRAEQEVRIRHTADAQTRLKEAHQILGLTNKLFAELDCIFNRMSETDLKKASLNEYLARVFPDPPREGYPSRAPRIRENVRELIETGRGAEAAKGTLWGAYNAVAEYVDHYRIPKAGDSARLKSMWFGNGERIKKVAFRIAIGMLN
jgi:phage/plasmid-like protein (TIGR03299 family)